MIYAPRDSKADSGPANNRETDARWAAAARDAGLGVGHIWTSVQCPAYRTLAGADCTCGRAS